MKKLIKIGFVFVSIITIIFLPYLLIIDFNRFVPIVLLIWVLLVVYYIFLKKKISKKSDDK